MPAAAGICLLKNILLFETGYVDVAAAVSSLTASDCTYLPADIRSASERYQLPLSELDCLLAG